MMRAPWTEPEYMHDCWEAGWKAIQIAEDTFLARQREEQRAQEPKGSDEVLGGHLDPVCPKCGKETELGEIHRLSDTVFKVLYDCGHTMRCSWLQLQERTQRNPDKPDALIQFAGVNLD